MMTAYRPDVVLNARYSVKETAAILGIHPNTVRNYVKEQKLRAVYSTVNGWPRFTGAAILKLWEQTI